MNYFKKFNKLKVKYKDKVIPIFPLFLAALTLFTITIGGSYAYLTSIAESSSSTRIEAGELALSFTNGSNNLSILNAVPTEDAVALESNDNIYTFNIKNTGTISSYYELKFNNVCTTSSSVTINGSQITPDVCIPIEYIKVAIKKEYNSLVEGLAEGTYSLKTLSDEGTILLDSGMLTPSEETNTYSLKIWLDVNTPNTYNNPNQNIVIAGKLNLYAEQRNVITLDEQCLTVDNGVITEYNCNYQDIIIPDHLTYKKSSYEFSLNECIEAFKKLPFEEDYDADDLDQYLIDNEMTMEEFLESIEEECGYIIPYLEVIPEEYIEYYNEMFAASGTPNAIKKTEPVMVAEEITEIASTVFAEKGLKSVVIGEGITTFGREAFSNNENLKDVTIKANDFTLTGESIFENDNIINLKDANGNYPEQCFELNNSGVLTSFKCSGSTKVVFPATVNGIQLKVINDNMDSQSNTFKYVDFSNAIYLTTIDDNTFKANTSLSHMGFIRTVDLSHNINLTNIGEYAFKDNLVKTLIFPSTGNITIEQYAFETNELSSLTIGPSITSIGVRAFAHGNIKYLDMSNATGLTQLNDYVFYNNEIENLSLPMNGNITAIGISTFECGSNDIILEKIDIPSSIAQINTYAFKGYKAIKKIDFSHATSLTMIGNYVFEGKTSNKENADVEILDLSNSPIISIGGGSFKNRKNIKKVIVPETLTSINFESFTLTDEGYEIYDTTGVTPKGCFSVSNNKINGYNCSGNKILTIPSVINNNVITEAYLDGPNAEIIYMAPTLTSLSGITKMSTTGNYKLKTIVNTTNNAFDWSRLLKGVITTPTLSGSIETVTGTVTIKRALPNDYQQVEYIESSGTQYINTGVIGKTNTIVNATLEWESLPNDSSVLASRTGATRYYPIHGETSKWAIGYTSFISTGTSLTANTKYTVESTMNQSLQRVKINGTAVYSNTQSQAVNTNLNMYLFAMNYDGTANYYSSIKLYSMQIIQDGKEVRNLIPCYKKSNNVIGMYDTINDVFYVNAGSGTFAKGSDI